MNPFFLIVFMLFAGNFVWWAWADAWLRAVGRDRRRRATAPWRVVVGALALAQAGMFVFLFYSRAVDSTVQLPAVLTAMLYLWHLIVLPMVVVALVTVGMIRLVGWIVGGIRRAPLATPHPGAAPPADFSHLAHVEAAPSPVGPTRRQLLATALVAAAPPLAGVVATSTAMATLGSFRVRSIDIAFANLPAALDGVRIAHLSDTHIGRFTTRADVDRIVRATNGLNADVIAFTGDLIDFDLADLPAGLDLLQRLQPRHRVVMCEGNHDLFQDRRAFERTVLNAGVPLLLNESHTVDVRGYPLQFLGVAWGTAAAGRSPLLAESAARTLSRHRSDAFSVLLAHHPHAFDFAARQGVNLTLAGHTHGGQLMLTPNVGPGPLMYRYWSGLYRQRDAACVVSNGIGNWFPLRTNAPAEIVNITLRRA